MIEVPGGPKVVGQGMQGWPGDCDHPAQPGRDAALDPGHSYGRLPIGSDAVIVCACGPDNNNPVRCRRCGHVTLRGRLRTDRYLRRSLRGVRHVAAEMCEPDEYEIVCPDCGARELFDDMIRCSECMEYPCICTPDGSWRA